jgi:hypothetical protein
VFLLNNSPVELPPQDIVVDAHPFFNHPVLWWPRMALPNQEQYCCINDCHVALVGDFSIKLLAKWIQKLIFKQNNNKLTV